VAYQRGGLPRLFRETGLFWYHGYARGSEYLYSLLPYPVTLYSFTPDRLLLPFDPYKESSGDTPMPQKCPLTTRLLLFYSATFPLTTNQVRLTVTKPRSHRSYVNLNCPKFSVAFKLSNTTTTSPCTDRSTLSDP
jgi:hypothetical protein